MIKSTYSLSEETVRELDRLAKHHAISKSEVLRRAVHQMARQDHPSEGGETTAALDELQRRLGLTAQAADAWASQVRRERFAVERT